VHPGQEELRLSQEDPRMRADGSHLRAEDLRMRTDGLPASNGDLDPGLARSRCTRRGFLAAALDAACTPASASFFAPAFASAFAPSFASAFAPAFASTFAPASAPAFAVAAEIAAPPRILDFDWVDVRRNRPVPCRLYLPARTAAGHRSPLVVFSHGLGGSRTGYRYLGSYLAEHGVASIHPQHVGSDRQLWASGNPLALLERLNGASSDSEAIARVADLRFVLDQVFARGASRSDEGSDDHEALASIDPQAIVVAGHSYGANTAMLVAGAQVERDGKPVALRDERVRAAVLISAPPFYGEQSQARILAAIRIPTLHITATEDLIRIPGLRSGLEDRIAVFDATASRFKCLAVFEGGSHSVFTDRFGSGDYGSNVRIKQATRELCLAFLQALGSALPGFVAPGAREKQNGVPLASSGSASDDLARWEKRHASLLHRFIRRS